jgi:hypothetical protein
LVSKLILMACRPNQHKNRVSTWWSS